jgi:hypothetical protein
MFDSFYRQATKTLGYRAFLMLAQQQVLLHPWLTRHFNVPPA